MKEIVGVRMPQSMIDELEEFVEEDEEFKSKQDAIRWAISMMMERWRTEK